MNCQVKLDTIALNKQFKTINSINDLIIDISAFTENINKSYVHNQYKITKKYILNSDIKAKIYGLEKLEIKQVYFESMDGSETVIYVPIMSIMLTWSID